MLLSSIGLNRVLVIRTMYICNKISKYEIFNELNRELKKNLYKPAHQRGTIEVYDIEYN